MAIGVDARSADRRAGSIVLHTQSFAGKNMTPADKLLDHFDRLAGSEPRFVPVSDEGTSPAM